MKIHPALALALLSTVSALPAVALADCPLDGTDGSTIATLGSDVSAVDAAAGCGGALPLGQTLADAAKTPEGRAQIEAAFGQIAKLTGIAPTSAALDALLADPAAIDRLLTVRIPELSAALTKAQGLSDLRGHENAAPAAYKLPDGVDFADAPGLMDGSVDQPTKIAGQLMHGDRPSDIAPAQAQRNRALSEIMTRLALNNGKPRGEKFGVTYKGRRYESNDSLLAALRRNGNTVNGSVHHGVANFIDLYVDRGSGVTCDVMTAVMVKTGYKDAAGNEIVVPAVHSGLQFQISGPDANATVSYFQGVGGTGFFPEGLGKDQAWVGDRVSATFSGADAVKAASVASLWTSSVDEIQKKDHLLGGGYGQTGVCNDSVALVEMMLNGSTSIYPLSMDKSLVTKYLDEKIAEGGRSAKRYQALENAINAMPNDRGADSTAPSRILGSMPDFGANGPFPGVDAARATFGAGTN